MSDIKQKALALVNEARSPFSARQIENLDDVMSWEAVDALCRAIEQLEAEKAARAADREQHEAFRQEVSEAIDSSLLTPETEAHLSRFIIAKPDPLVEALDEALWEVCIVKLTDRELRDVSLRLNAKRGGKIEGEG